MTPGALLQRSPSFEPRAHQPVSKSMFKIMKQSSTLEEERSAQL